MLVLPVQRFGELQLGDWHRFITDGCSKPSIVVPMLLILRLARVLARDTYLSQSKKAKLFEEQVCSQQ
jgi:hypothetical protein